MHAARYVWTLVGLAALAGPAAVVAQQVREAPGTSGNTVSLAAPYAIASASHSPAVVPFAAGATPTAPVGFTVTPFATGLDSPRNALVLPNGDVLVAEAKTERKYDDPSFRDAGANRITLLRDRDG